MNSNDPKMTYEFDEMSPNEIKDLFKQWRENNERRSEDVVRVWLQNPDAHSKFGNDEHIILEQVIVAALDTHKYSLAELSIKQLSGEFPESLRVMRHKAVLLEVLGKYDDATAVLDHIIKKDETNAPARKRRVAILKAQGLVPEAIKELVDYLKKFMSDVEGWQELTDLYLSVGEYPRALFCAEELLLQQPHNHLAHQCVADILFTMGGVDNLESAKSYYCQALKLNPDNMRALLGLFLTTGSLLQHYKSPGNSGKRNEIWKLCQWARSEATKKQKQANASNSLTQMMLTLAINE